MLTCGALVHTYSIKPVACGWGEDEHENKAAMYNECTMTTRRANHNDTSRRTMRDLETTKGKESNDSQKPFVCVCAPFALSSLVCPNGLGFLLCALSLSLSGLVHHRAVLASLAACACVRVRIKIRRVFLSKCCGLVARALSISSLFIHRKARRCV